MKQATLCFLIRRGAPDAVLLGLKKRGFGCGKYNGFGGKIEPGEDARQAVVREIAEEAGLAVRTEDLVPAGRVTFFFPANPAFDHDVALFVATVWRGEPCESE
jgi:8-oxo-dGTP diphosphatase